MRRGAVTPKTNKQWQTFPFFAWDMTAFFVIITVNYTDNKTDHSLTMVLGLN
jgi:hypothetical protein